MSLTELIQWLDRLFQHNVGHPYIAEQTATFRSVRKQLIDAYHVDDSRDAALTQLQALLTNLATVNQINYQGISQPHNLSWAISGNRIEWDRPRIIALLDVDHTLCYFHDDDIIFNQILLDTLKTKGIEDIYLFTDMTFNSNNFEIRKKVIDELHQQGVTVHGVVTPNDYLWNHATLLDNFECEFHAYATEHTINLKYSRGLDKVKNFFALNNGKYNPLLSIEPQELPELGAAYDEVHRSTLYSEDSTVELIPADKKSLSIVIKLATDLISIARDYPPGKHLLFELFFAKLNIPGVVSGIFFDDKWPNILSCPYMLERSNTLFPVSACHVPDAAYDARGSVFYNEDDTCQYYIEAILEHSSAESSVICSSSYLARARLYNCQTVEALGGFNAFIRESNRFLPLALLAAAAVSYAKAQPAMSQLALDDDERDKHIELAKSFLAKRARVTTILEKANQGGSPGFFRKHIKPKEAESDVKIRIETIIEKIYRDLFDDEGLQHYLQTLISYGDSELNAMIMGKEKNKAAAKKFDHLKAELATFLDTEFPEREPSRHSYEMS